MQNTRCFKILITSSLYLLLVGCASPASTEPIPAATTVTMTATQPSTAVFTSTPVPLPTSTLETLQIGEPAVEPASVPEGMVIYDDTRNILVFDLQTGQKSILISRQDLENQLPADRSAESTTFETGTPLRVFFSPDFTKARISICANLDEEFRCGFREFIYDIDTKSIVELDAPPATYGVDWHWSPDGSKLAGSGWTYVGKVFTNTGYYAINSDGSNLTQIGVSKTNDWRTVWHPGGQAILPMTTQNQFNTIVADGSGITKVNIDELKNNEKMECLSFSSDYQKAAFIARRENDENRDWAYISRSDFEFPSMVFELGMDSRYHCEIGWSPDHKFFHIQYKPGWENSFDLELEREPLPQLDFVYDIEKTGTLLNIPESASICGWTPDSKLIYTQDNSFGNPGIVGLFDPATVTTVALPDNLQKSLRGCPIAWLPELDLNLPEDVQATNACRPGQPIQDIEEISITIPYFNILEFFTVLENEKLTASIKMEAASADLKNYLSPDVQNFANGWDVLIDIDDNILTGDQAGIEYRMVASIRPEANGTRASLVGGVLEFSKQASTYNPIGEAVIFLDEANSLLNISGNIPGITPNARIVITSRVILSVTNGRPNVAGDIVCE